MKLARCVERRHVGLLLAAGLVASPPALAGKELHPPGSSRQSPGFYEVAGRRYHVLADAEGYVALGVASWYGSAFHGKQTASGEVFDMHAMTAAHRTLPIPTDVEVTNLRNGKTIIVRVNDRGPFVGKRIIDLSYAAARALDLVGVGIGRVRVRALQSAPHVTAQAASNPSRFVQVGAYRLRANAERMREQLEASGFNDVSVSVDPVGGERFARVRLGPIPDEAAHDRLIRRLASIGVRDAFLVE